jgi:hypothetical protein
MLAVMFSLFKNFFNVFGYDVAIFTLFKSFIELKLNLLGTAIETLHFEKPSFSKTFIS